MAHEGLVTGYDCSVCPPWDGYGAPTPPAPVTHVGAGTDPYYDEHRDFRLKGSVRQVLVFVLGRDRGA